MRMNVDNEINHPPHYCIGGGRETIEIIDEILGRLGCSTPDIGYCVGNAIKYICRFPFKGGAADLRKAAWYCNHAAEIIDASKLDRCEEFEGAGRNALGGSD
jgi:hypothetical protein